MLTAAQSALAAIIATLAGTTPGPLPSRYPDVASAIQNYQGATAHLFALQHAGEIENSLRQALIAQTEAVIRTAQTQLQAFQARLTAQITVLTQQVTNDQAQLAAAQVNLAALEQLLNGDTVLPMPLLHVDAPGLTTSGAVLGFAPAAGLPVLFDGALGRVTLYFRRCWRVPARLLRHVQRPRHAAPAGRDRRGHLRGAVRNAVATYLPDLLPHTDDILAFLVLYYGVSDAPQLAGAQPSA